VFGVEPICTVLSEHGCKMAPSSYYQARNRQPSKRAVRHAEIVALIEKARDDRFRSGLVPARCGCICAHKAMTWPGAPWSG
jgi:hypothetical protein